MDNTTSVGVQYLPRPLNVWGLVVLIIFYVIILAVGVWASIKKKVLREGDVDRIVLAERKVGSIVGIFTMTATWVGGGYINGTAEFVFTPGYGLAWTQAMWGFSISLLLAGLVYAKPMREAEYVTMLDPFCRRYGKFVAAIMYLPAVCSELFWSGAILSALGASLYVILGVSRVVAIIISALIAAVYTVIGGLYSVVFTDVIQITFIFVGLWIGVGFGIANPAVVSIWDTALQPNKYNESGWVGELPPDPYVGHWLDFGLLLIFGGIPWQVYFQRVLSSESPRSAQILSIFGGIGCLIMAIPAVLIGAIAKSADWDQTDYKLYWPLPVEEENYQMILPIALQFLTPPVVAIIGLAAVSAAVMSSADSSFLSSSSMFAWNVYKPLRELSIFESEPTETEILWVMRITVFILGFLACLLAIIVNSTYALFVLCGDFVYVVAFPQLTCVLFMKKANTYGAIAGYFVSFFIRLTAGEPTLSFPPLFKYWYYDESTGIQCFPVRTFAMLLGLLAIIIVSYLTHMWLPKEWDVLDAIRDDDGSWKKPPIKQDLIGELDSQPPPYLAKVVGVEAKEHPYAYDNVQYTTHL